MMRFIVALVCVLLVFMVMAPTVTAEPWWPEPCQGLHWWSPSGDVWDCLMAVMNELFPGGTSTWFEDPPGW